MTNLEHAVIRAAVRWARGIDQSEAGKRLSWEQCYRPVNRLCRAVHRYFVAQHRRAGKKGKRYKENTR